MSEIRIQPEQVDALASELMAKIDQAESVMKQGIASYDRLYAETSSNRVSKLKSEWDPAVTGSLNKLRELVQSQQQQLKAAAEAFRMADMQ
jgi:uncharacterized protein YukE